MADGEWERPFSGRKEITQQNLMTRWRRRDRESLASVTCGGRNDSDASGCSHDIRPAAVQLPTAHNKKWNQSKRRFDICSLLFGNDIWPATLYVLLCYVFSVLTTWIWIIPRNLSLAKRKPIFVFHLLNTIWDCQRNQTDGFSSVFSWVVKYNFILGKNKWIRKEKKIKTQQ